MARCNLDSRTFSIILYDTEEDNKILEQAKKNYNYAYILHDKDVDEFGELKKAHYHLILRWNDTKSINALSMELSIPIEKITKIKNYKSSIRYLTHIDYKEKYQYDLNNISTNMDIKEYFDDELTELQKVKLIAEIINNENISSKRYILDIVIEKGLWSEYRRGYAIWKDILQEIRIEKGEP